jgi:large subunit ribosomal protein L4
MVLSDRAANNSLVVLEKLALETFKTKIFNGIINSLEEKVFNTFTIDAKKKSRNKYVRSTGRSVLFINDAKDEKVNNSGRNLSGVKIINLDNINIVDLLNYKNLIITDKAVDKLEAVYQEKTDK